MNTSLSQIDDIRARGAHEIQSSNWSVGVETMDRDYIIYDEWNEYLEPLGVKKARLQAGWAKTERTPGQYDWAWHDEIIPAIAAKDVEPWVCLCYGNPLYMDTNDIGLGGPIPNTEEALDAWVQWVEGMVVRYREYVDEWEIWNEPNNGQATPEEYADLFERTAPAIHARQPEADVLGISLAGDSDHDFVRNVLDRLETRGLLHHLDQVTYHPYRKNPDACYPQVEALQEVLAEYDTDATLRQGENGAPSERQDNYALRDRDWTETQQAKWALRRLLGDLGRGIESSYFALIDLNYPDIINRKGLLYATEDQTVDHVKEAYDAVQHLTSTFDASLERIPGYAHEHDADTSLSVFGYHRPFSGEQIVTIWEDGAIPTDTPDPTSVSVTAYESTFDAPVFVDLRTGAVYEVPDDSWSRSGSVSRFEAVPVYDSPVLIAEATLLHLAGDDEDPDPRDAA